MAANLERIRRADAVPANRVTVLDPPPADETDPFGRPTVYVHIDTINLVQPAAPVIHAPRAPARPARRRKRRRHASPLTRAIVRPFLALAFGIAAVIVMHAVFADPVTFSDHLQAITR